MRYTIKQSGGLVDTLAGVFHTLEAAKIALAKTADILSDAKLSDDGEVFTIFMNDNTPRTYRVVEIHTMESLV
jgi:hypothetical protein